MRTKRSPRLAVIRLAALAVLSSRSHFAAADVTATWISAQNGSYASQSKWSTAPNFPANGKPAGTDYVALINAVGKDYLITYSSGDGVDFLDIDSGFATLEQVGGTFTPTVVNLDEGTFSVTAGVLQDSTINIGSAFFEATGGTLNDVTIDGSTAYDPAAGGTGSIVAIDPASVTITGESTLPITNSLVELGGTFSPTNISKVSLDSNSSFAIASGTLQNTGDTTTLANYGGSSQWYLEGGGEISGGTINLTGTTFTALSGILNDVSFTGGDINQIGGTVTIQNGLDLGGHTLNIGEFSAVSFDGPSQTINNLTLSTGGYVNLYVGGPTSTGPVTLTLGQNVNIGGDPDFADNRSIAGNTLVNDGTITSAYISVSNFINNGSLQVNYINIGSNSWTNNGTISVPANGYLQLGGVFTTADIGSLSADPAGTIEISGTLNNSGANLNLSAMGGAWILAGTINGGTVNQGTQLLLGNSTLNNVQFTGSGDVQMSLFASATFQNDVSFTNLTNIDMDGVEDSIILDGPSQSIDNVDINSETGDQGIICVGGPTTTGPITLTLGPNATVRGNVAIEEYSTDSGEATLVNNGTINADDPTGPGLVIATTNFTNNGNVEASNEALLQINSANWTNNGTISVTNNSLISLGGTFTPANLGNFSVDSTSAVEIAGTLNNTGSTLNIAPYGGSWSVYNGTITGGIVNQGSQPFLIYNGTLNNVEFTGSGDLAMDFPGSGTLNIENGLTFLAPTNLDVGIFGTVNFLGPTQTIDNINLIAALPGDSDVYIGDNTNDGPHSLTFGPHSTVNGMNFFPGANDADEVTLVNNGIMNNVAEYINSFVNNGTIEATNGGTLQISSANFTNTGTIAVHGGGTIIDTNLLDVGEGTLTGDGTIDANVQLDSDPSTLAFNIGGELQDTDYDSLIINGNISLGGNLEITLTNGFIPNPGDVFTVLDVEDGGALSGDFANVLDGQDLLTTDGTGEFVVNYSPDSGEIVLSDFQEVPEPASAALLLSATGAMLMRRRRK